MIKEKYIILAYDSEEYDRITKKRKIFNYFGNDYFIGNFLKKSSK